METHETVGKGFGDEKDDVVIFDLLANSENYIIQNRLNFSKTNTNSMHRVTILWALNECAFKGCNSRI